MKLKIVQRAEPNERFAPTAFDGQIGKTIPLRIGERTTPCKLVAASVADDGLSVELTIETDEPAALAEPGLFHSVGRGMSIKFEPAPAEPLRTDRTDWDPGHP